MVPQTPPDGDRAAASVRTDHDAPKQPPSDRDSRLKSCKHGENTGRDLPRAAAVTRGHGERLLGVMLVGNAILRLREEREQSQYVRIQTHNSATRHHHTGIRLQDNKYQLTEKLLLQYCCCNTAVILLYYYCNTAVLLLHYCVNPGENPNRPSFVVRTCARAFLRAQVT